ncbi:MAG TPA: response regulator [Bryobacteraceae bacterium]|jgi:CheY-like chemotaxis protein|nr:response regulator [Bryobacteraceae bacterium]
MHKARIMLVEDEKVVAADIQECVKSLGYEVVGSVATGTDALRLAVNTMPDLVLMDIKLKGILDGIDVAGALYDQLKIPVVYLTAHADAQILERAKLTAPSGYVLKPFDDRTLRTAIELAFDRYRRERQLIEGGRRLAAAIGSIDEAVIVTQENGKVALMNRVAEALTGWNQEDALGKPVDEVFTILNARTGAPRPSPVSRVFREGVAIGLGDDVLLLGTKGTREPIQGSVTPVRDGDTQPVGVCLLFRAASLRGADEPWGTLNHGSASRLEILGRLTAAVAHKFTSLLEAGRGRTHAARLASRLLEFGRRQPAPPSDLDLNGFIAGMDDLLQCALGDDIALQLTLAPAGCAGKVDSGCVELILMHLAIAARDTALPGQFSIETSAVASEDSGDGYAIVTVIPPGAGRDLPALDEIVRQCLGEIRIAAENGVTKIYVPLEGGL